MSSTDMEVSAITPSIYRNIGKNIKITYGFAECPFGIAGLAKAGDGICALAFFNNPDKNAFVASLQKHWALSDMVFDDRAAAETIQQIFQGPGNSFSLMPIGSQFQIKVWNALLAIPAGTTSTYREIAAAINQPKAIRAVASAIAKNPIAYLIPCHRIIRSDGSLGGYRWGTERKQTIITSELEQGTR